MFLKCLYIWIYLSTLEIGFETKIVEMAKLANQSKQQEHKSVA